MTRITADLGDLYHMEFKTEEDWKKYIEHKISRYKKHYDPQPRNLHPAQFPCLMLYDDCIIYCPDGNDEFSNFFLYDYSFEKEEPDEDILVDEIATEKYGQVMFDYKEHNRKAREQEETINGNTEYE